MKRPIDLGRDSGGSASIGEENGKPIRMMSMDDRLVIIAERGIVSVQLADQIDPGRSNINVPSSVQRPELSRGTTSPLVAWTLMTALEVFQPLHLPEGFPTEEAINRSLGVAKNLSEIQDSADALSAFQAGVQDGLTAGSQKASKLPSYPNLRGSCEHSIHLARTAVTELMWLVNVFFPKANPRDVWHKPLVEHIESLGREEKERLKSISGMIALIEAVNDYRNACIHPDASKRLEVFNYELRPDMSILAPTLEIHHPNSPLPRQDVQRFLSQLAEGIAFTYEGMVAYMASLKTRQFGPFQTALVALPEGEERDGARVAWHTVAPENWPSKPQV